MKSFVAGIGSIAILMGFLVGASNSPVAGVAVTAAFGVVAAAISIFETGKRGGADLESLGRLLLAFSATFAIGLGAGIAVKLSEDNGSRATAFPWQGLAAPQSAKAAIDWILVQHNLKALGFNDAQVSELYKLQSEKNPSALQGNFAESELLSPLFSEKVVPSSKRHIVATQNDLPFLGREPS